MFHSQIRHKNAAASADLIIPLNITCNTPDEVLFANIEANSRLPKEWVKVEEAHDTPAIMVGGGASVIDYIAEIKERQDKGAKIFSMNGTASFLADAGIFADYQVIVDAREETQNLIGPAFEYLFASQVHPSLFEEEPDARLWHLECGGIEDHFPEYEDAYALVLSSASVGNCALSLAYCLGYRDFHIYGYDSSFKDDKSHAYFQAMNVGEPSCMMNYGGTEYKVSLAMKCQAEKFPQIANLLKANGCTVEVYGEGLLQDMYRGLNSGELTEKDKYTAMWNYDEYRGCAPGEFCADKFLEVVKPDSSIIDFGCGTGRGALAIHNAGHDVLCIDFASNCRDEAAEILPFIEWDLTQVIPIGAKYGYCTDVMEHIPPEDVEKVITNIMNSVTEAFFQISLVDDVCGTLIGHPLHLSVHPYSWWMELFPQMGYAIMWSEDCGATAMFHIRRKG